MRAAKKLAAVGLAIALFGSATPASAQADVYRHYVACGLSQNAKPSHVCQKARKKGAFFRSKRGDVFYTVCVRFPTGKNLCATEEEAVQGTLYVNEITSNIPGVHKVTWFVKGKRVGLFKFIVPV
jgi:hypothetical protein